MVLTENKTVTLNVGHNSMIYFICQNIAWSSGLYIFENGTLRPVIEFTDSYVTFAASDAVSISITSTKPGNFRYFLWNLQQ